MATVDGFTAEYTQALIDGTIVDAEVDAGGNLIVTRFDGTTFNAGHVKGDDAVPADLNLFNVDGIMSELTTITMPNDPDSNGIYIRDNAAFPRSGVGGGVLTMWFDYLGAPIFAVPAAGGPKTFGDHMGVWTGVFDRAIGFSPWGTLEIGYVQPKQVFFSTAGPLDAETLDQLDRMNNYARLGDICFSLTDRRTVWKCIESGTLASPQGTWVPETMGSSLKSITNHSTTSAITNSEEVVWAYNTITLTLPNPNTLIHGQHLTIKNGGTGVVTVQSHAGAIIEGVSSRTLAPGEVLNLMGITASWVLTDSNITPGTAAQYYRGDKTWQTLDKAAVGLGNVANLAQMDLVNAQTAAGLKTFSGGVQIVNNTAFRFVDSGGTTRRIALLSGGNSIYYGDIDNAMNASLLLMAGGSGIIQLFQNGIQIASVRSTGLHVDVGNLNLHAAAQMVIGGDTNLYRSAANVLKTDDVFHALQLFDNGNRVYSASSPPSFAAITGAASLAQMPAGGAASQYLRGDKTWQTLDKAAAGLGNVDNVQQYSASNPPPFSVVTGKANPDTQINDLVFTAPTLAANWANAGGNNADAGYAKMGSVGYLKGTILRSVSAYAAYTTIFSLGAGYIPSKTQLVPAMIMSGAGTAVTPTMLQITLLGEVKSIIAVPAGSYLALSCTYFINA